jgi:hypothetical protein
MHLVFLEVDSAWLSLDGFVLGFVCCVFLSCCDEWRGGMRGRRLGGCSFGGVCSGYFGLVLGCLGLAEK